MRNSQRNEESRREISEARPAQIIPFAVRSREKREKSKETEASPSSRKIFLESRMEILGLIKDEIKTNVWWLSIWHMALKTAALLGLIYALWKHYSEGP